MEENTRNSGQGLGVAALIMGIISFVVAFIPCVGLLAMFTAIIAIVLGAIGMSQASRDNSPKGLMLGGLIIGVFALFISIAQIVVVAGLSNKAGFIEEKIEEIVDEIGEGIMGEFDNGDFTITIEDGDDKVEIKSSVRKSELIDKLEELEDANSVGITIKIDTSGGE